ncbi:MAG: hypothetical protein WA432_04555 [Candidatus Babeliaceae bacterium]
MKRSLYLLITTICLSSPQTLTAMDMPISRKELFYAASNTDDILVLENLLSANIFANLDEHYKIYKQKLNDDTLMSLLADYKIQVNFLELIRKKQLN